MNMLLNFISTTQLACGPFELSIISVSLLLLLRWCRSIRSEKLIIPVVNKSFYLEPKIFAKLRWAFNARKILDSAYDKYRERVYRVDRGDVEILILPYERIGELNALPESVVSSREAHSYNLLGHLNEIQTVTQTNLHVKTLLGKLTPALPLLTATLKPRLWRAINHTLPEDSEPWNSFTPLRPIIEWISHAFALVSFAPPLCDDAELLHLVSQLTWLVFPIVIMMRLVPVQLQSALVWLLPQKWRLNHSFKRLETLITPQVQTIMNSSGSDQTNTMLSWLIRGSRNGVERNPVFLAKLIANLATGATHTTAMLIDNVLFDLAAHPSLQQEIREEIITTHVQTEGKWTFEAFNCLQKLDSVLKESARLAGPSMTVYNRMMQSDHTLSDGAVLKKGQLIAVSACSIQRDDHFFPSPDEYHGLRAYEQSRLDGQPHNFSLVEPDLAWGSGRGACPGRWLAALEAKIVLVKIVADWDLALCEGAKRPRTLRVQEFGFMGENEMLRLKKRHDGLGLL